MTSAERAIREVEEGAGLGEVCFVERAKNRVKIMESGSGKEGSTAWWYVRKE